MKKHIIFITLVTLLTLVTGNKEAKVKRLKKTERGNHTTIQGKYFAPHQNEIIAGVNILLSITAFLGNALIIVALLKPSSLNPSSKLLLGCLASTDLFVGLISQPLFVYHLLTPEDSKPFYPPEFKYKLLGFIFCGVSLLTVAVISVDRLLALSLGLRYRQVVTLRRTWVVVVLFWLSNTALAVISHFHFDVAKYMIVITITLCLGTSTFCYIKIYLIPRQQQARVLEHIHQGQPNGGGIPLNIARYRKTVSSALWVQVTLVACYLPFGITLSIHAARVTRFSYLDLAGHITNTLLMFNSTLNPFLYCWKMKEVRQAVKSTIRKLTCSFT